MMDNFGWPQWIMAVVMSDYIRPVVPQDHDIWPALKDEKFIVCKAHGKMILSKGDYSKYCAICGGKL